MQTASRPLGYAGREVTQPPNWHALVAADFFLNALATGLFLAAAAGELARPDVFAAPASWAYPLALALLLLDLSCLVLDLGDPLRFHHMLRVLKPTSPMSLGTWCLTAYSLPLTLLVVVDLCGVVGWVRVALIVVALPFAFGSAAYKGVLFSTTAQPGWRDARWLGAYHIASAVMLGGAVLLLLAVLLGHGRAAAVLSPAVAALVVVGAVPLALLAGELWPAAARAWGANRRDVFAELLFAGGVLLPLVLLLIGGAASVVAAVLLLAGGYAVRSVVVHLPHRAR